MRIRKPNNQAGSLEARVTIMFKHLLIPTDGSAIAKKAATQGVKFAQETGAKVTGFFASPVYRPVVYEDFVPANYMSPKQHEEATAKLAAKYLGPIEKACKEAGVPFQSLHTASEFPADAIIEAAKAKKCDLIFMGSHGRRGLAGVLLGSETAKVLTHSKIPVLVYR
jgi:nucleotide-binding universal stress UspA family protein